MYKYSNWWPWDILKYFLEVYRPIPVPHFVYDFSIFSMLYSIKWPHFFVWLSLFLEILGNVCTITIFLQLVMPSAVIFYFRQTEMSIHSDLCFKKRKLYKSNQFILLQGELENATVKLILHRSVDSGNSTFQVEDICLALET